MFKIMVLLFCFCLQIQRANAFEDTDFLTDISPGSEFSLTQNLEFNSETKLIFQNGKCITSDEFNPRVQSSVLEIMFQDESEPVQQHTLKAKKLIVTKVETNNDHTILMYLKVDKKLVLKMLFGPESSFYDFKKIFGELIIPSTIKLNDSRSLYRPKDIYSIEDFEKVIQESKIPVIFDYYADWCGPCRKMNPAIEELAKLYDQKIIFLKIHLDKSTASIKSTNQGIPELQFYYLGKRTGVLIGGGKTIENLNDWIKSNIHSVDQ